MNPFLNFKINIITRALFFKLVSTHGNTLKVLDLSYSGVRDSHLSRLTFLPALEELNLDSCLVSDWAIAHLVDNNVTPNLTSLDLADSDLTDNGMEYIAKFTKLKKLSLFYCNISNIGLRHLAHLKSLEELNLDSRDVGDQGLSYLSGLPNLRAYYRLWMYSFV